MNLKLNNDARNSRNLSTMAASSVKEERRRTGRYIAILVGISLLFLAIYHAWVRRIPVVASLVVPALIMFIYVGWVLYTASRDKKRALKLQAALSAISHQRLENGQSTDTPNIIEIAVIPNKDLSKTEITEIKKDLKISKLTTTATKEDTQKPPDNFKNKTKPLILVNDEIPADLDQKFLDITPCKVESIPNSIKFANILSRRRFKRKFCRSRKNAVFKRSYSIA